MMPKREMMRVPLDVHFQSTEKGKVQGIAANWGKENANGTIFERGSFAAAIEKVANGGSIPMLWQHDVTKPIGKWTKLTETDEGLIVRGKLTMDADNAATAYAVLKDEAISGISVGVYVNDFEATPSGARRVTNADLAEISIVTLPSDDDARVRDVHGVNDDPETKAQKAATEGGNDMPTDTASELDAKLTKAVDRIADLEASAANIDAAPAAANTNRAPEDKAFERFARVGQQAMTPEEIHALNSGTDAQGGALVPEDYRAELIREITETSPMRQLSRTTNTGRDELIMPKRLTKLAGGWTAELADRPEDEPTYGQIKIPVHELGVFTAISNQNLEDAAFSMQAELTSDFAEAFGEAESAAFILGDGAGKPKGILDSADIQADATANGGVIDADDLITTFYRVKASYRNNGAFLMNSNTLAEVRKLKTANGDYIWRESLAEGQPATILGRPVYEAPDMPDPVANAKAVLFGDMSRAYRVVSRLEISVLRDPYSLAAKSMVRFHARMRVGGDVVLAEAARTIQVA